ncbi:MAG: OmpA family protein, partial [Bacteroidota bacterium]|nr:OmpA family protein [Bacteroidota bacterium]
AGILPVGIGYKLALGESADMDFNMGATMTTTDNLNYFKNGKMPDYYYFAGVGVMFGGGPKDADHDGLLNWQEEQLGTNPKNPDTDGDGLSDGDEVMKYHTNPLKADTDGDGLSDYDEIMKYHTNPLKADTDGDGLNDGEEVLTYKTDPLKADTDGDGLSDGDEVMKYKTDPLKIDTDGDGLSDYDEIMKYHTDPLNADTDGDGLKDGEEVMKYKTDPLKADTDGGSVNDCVEVGRGSNPLNPNDDVMKIGDAVVLEGITFETNKAVIKPESEITLKKVLQTLKFNPDVFVEIAGYTDNVGKDKSNMILSLRRAEAVKQWLVDKGIDFARMETKGYGKAFPIASNDTPEGREKNRRIEFKRTK